MDLILLVCEIQDITLGVFWPIKFDREEKTLKTHDKKDSLKKIKINW